MNGFSLEVRGLKKSFGFKPVLRGVTLDVSAGERVALLGANGAGKTTLLRILAMLSRPTAGTVCLNGLDSERNAQQVRRLVGFVAHSPYLYDELTALENLLFFCKMYTVQDASERTRQLLRRVGLEKRANERVHTLSRGQVQRLSLARALLHAPQLLLLDEPDTGLDAEGNELLAELLSEHIREGGAVLFTTHQLERALTMSETILILDGGRIVSRQATIGLALDTMRQHYNEVLH
jgi:heme ABC exporter ATP-binding subunit CcmA